MEVIIVGLSTVVTWADAGKYFGHVIEKTPGAWLGSIEHVTEILKNMLLSCALLLIGAICLRMQIQLTNNMLIILTTLVGSIIGFAVTCSVVLKGWIKGAEK